MLNPMIGVGMLAVILIALTGMYQVGHIDGVAEAERDAQAALAVSLRRAIDQAAEIARQDAEILGADVLRQARVVTQFKLIDREVNRYALTHRDAVDCLDAGGLRLWRAAARGDAAEIATAAPGHAERFSAEVAGAGDGAGAGTTGQLHVGGAAVSPAARAFSNIGGVGALGAGAAVRE